MSKQIQFGVEERIVKVNECKKWDKLYKKLKNLQGYYKAGRVVNEISNEALVDKIIRDMERLDG